jgi:ubiquinone biosynthesis protein
MDWNTLIDVRAVGAMLREDHARFAHPIREALIVFLSGLPAAAQRDILVQQAALPASAGTAQRLRLLAQQCPVLHKLGQSLARDKRLHASLRQEFRKLEMLPCSIPPQTLRAALEQELGTLDRLGIELAPTAIAEASVAIVVAYRDQQRSGVFKILKPGIEERLALELELLGRVGLHLDQRCGELGIPKIGYDEAFRQISDKLQDEVRLDLEQQHLGVAASQYASHDRVQIPALHPYCTRRVTAMERVIGCKVTDHVELTTTQRARLAVDVASALLTRPILCTGENALFHGDPHAGNLLLTPDRRIAVLDWSLAGTLGQHEREAMIHMLLGAMQRDERRVAAMLANLAEGAAADEIRLRGVVEQQFCTLRPGQLPDFSWLIGLMDSAVERGGLQVRAELLLFRKALHTLHNLIIDIGSSDRLIDEALFAGFIQHLIAEWPLRWLALPHSRAFASRLSNADLAEVMLRAPSASFRFFMHSTLGAFSRTRAS